VVPPVASSIFKSPWVFWEFFRNHLLTVQLSPSVETAHSLSRLPSSSKPPSPLPATITHKWSIDRSIDRILLLLSSTSSAFQAPAVFAATAALLTHGCSLLLRPSKKRRLPPTSNCSRDRYVATNRKCRCFVSNT
jgi:hypothetical protein